jgi:5,10-methylenetetrahydromethanopterin reductase
VAVPFRIGLVMLTMEPVDELLAAAGAADEHGFDTVWLGEAYPWWRKHGMEARSSTVLGALIARETKRITIGWGIVSPYTRHPVQVAMDARVTQELVGNERFIVGFGTSRIFLNNAKLTGRTRPLAHVRDSVAIVRGALRGDSFSYDGEAYSADLPALSPKAHSPRGSVPVYVAGTAPKMQQLGGEIADGVLTASITTPAFVRWTRENVEEGARRAGRSAADIDIGCTLEASIGGDRDAGRDGARELTAMYLANKVQNNKGASDKLLESAGIEMDELAPIAAAMEQGGRRAAKAALSDDLLDRCKPIAGTPDDCVAAIEEFRDAGCTHIDLEIWGENRLEQIRMFGERVLPRVR